VADVVGVVFQDRSKTYHFDSAGLQLSCGDNVIVQTSKGAEIGRVVDAPHYVNDSDLSAPLKQVIRVATEEDREAQTSCIRRQAMMVCRERIAAHKLDMKLVSADVSLSGDRVTFSFYCDERVDFRGLVADLSRTLKMRVELRQIGAREEARMVGGLGPCGRHLCCTLFPGDDEPVSIRMAKEQNLPLNPVKISGLCGRLMCCLKYEQEQYVYFRKEAPPRGTRVVTPTGVGVITGYHVLKEAITVRMEGGSITDLRLRNCEPQEDGTLLFVPDVGEEAVVRSGGSGLSSPGLPADMKAAHASAGRDRGAAEEAQATKGSSGEDEEVRSKRPRSRRGRGRRGRGQGAGAEGVAAEGVAAMGGRVEAAPKPGVKQGGQQPGRRRPQQSGERPKDGAGRTSRRPNEKRPPTADGGRVSEQGAAAERKPRRRRRPRRPGGGESSDQGAGDGGRVYSGESHSGAAGGSPSA
jgi:cell fate regulator YaaT (PSP1 superfamily)